MGRRKGITFGPVHGISSLLRFENIQGFLSFFLHKQNKTETIRTKEKKICSNEILL